MMWEKKRWRIVNTQRDESMKFSIAGASVIYAPLWLQMETTSKRFMILDNLLEFCEKL